jgi:hypothetical protein
MLSVGDAGTGRVEKEQETAVPRHNRAAVYLIAGRGDWLSIPHELLGRRWKSEQVTETCSGSRP